MRDCRALLAKDCKPGEIAEFALDLDLTGPDKKPVPNWKQSDPWGYQLRFDIFNGQKWLTELGGRTLSRAIDVFDTDYGPRIVDCDLPKKLAAGQTSDVKIVIRNTGAQLWNRKYRRSAVVVSPRRDRDGVDGILTPIDKHPAGHVDRRPRAKAPDYTPACVWDRRSTMRKRCRGGYPLFAEVTASSPT